MQMEADSILRRTTLQLKMKKDKIIQDLQRKASLREDDAENVYDIGVKIITGEIKNKLKYAFRSQN